MNGKIKIIILLVAITTSSCLNLGIKRNIRIGNTIIRDIEAFKEVTHRAPFSLQELRASTTYGVWPCYSCDSE